MQFAHKLLHSCRKLCSNIFYCTQEWCARGTLFVKSKASVQLQQRNYVQERPFLSNSEPIPFTRHQQTDIATINDAVKFVTCRVRIISLLRVICGCFCLYDIWNKC